MKLEKITKTSRRQYHDACGTAHALDLIGERWALLIMRELMLGPRRFGDLRRSLPGISANVLAQRLEGLEVAGVLDRKRLPPPASVQVYELTAWGLEAEPIVSAMGRWGARSPMQDVSMPLSAVSMMLSFRTMFDARKAGDADISVQFVIGEEAFWMTVRNAALSSDRGLLETPDLVIEGKPEAIAGLVYGLAERKRLEDEGRLEIDGDNQTLTTFSDMFELPPKAE